MTDLGEPTAEAAMNVLRERGPLSAREWAKLLTEAGFGYLAEMEDVVEYIDHPLLGYLPDGRHVALDVLLEGRVFTHRLSAAEIAADILDAGPDLSAATILLDAGNVDMVSAFRDLDSDEFEKRGVEDPDWPAGEALVLPRGALEGYGEGDVIALAVRGGRLSRERGDAEALQRADLSTKLAEVVGPDQVEDSDAVLWQLMVDDHTLFTEPTTPISELFEAADYAAFGDYVAEAGFDMDGHQRLSAIERLARAYDLDAAETGAVLAFADLMDAIEQAPPQDRERVAHDCVAASKDAFAPLADSHAARAAYGVVSAAARTAPETLLEGAAALRRRGPRRLAPTAHWLSGKAAERAGDTFRAEQSFELAVTADSHWEPALQDLARYASDRGDAARALSLLDRTTDGPKEPMYRLLQRFVASDRPELGRNDRCWCGSGRKYKVCHLGKSDHTLDERAGWLYQKAGVEAQEIEWRSNVLGLAVIRSMYDDEPHALVRAIEDDLVVDVALFEGGIFESFVERRGSFLPPDELLLAQQWLLVERSVHEVIESRPGEGMTLRDARTGDRADVVERTASRQLHAGDFFCARVVPVGSTTQIFGGIEPIAAGQRGELIALLDDERTDPADLVEFLTARFAPPQLVTKDGHPLVVCTARFQLSQTANARRKLSRRFGASDGDTWHSVDGDSVLGTLELRGADSAELYIETMNEPRFEQLIDDVSSMDPTAVLMAETRTPAAQWLAEAAESDVLESPRQPADPDTADVLDQYIRDYERQWIDDSIPALEGYTPREAAADPTRRDDVMRLLDSMPADERPGTMSARRLRDMLGL